MYKVQNVVDNNPLPTLPIKLQQEQSVWECLLVNHHQTGTCLEDSDHND